MYRKFISLKGFSEHLLNEIIRADQDFQYRQQQAWSDFSSNQNLFQGIDLTTGFRKMESLFLSEVMYDFKIVPTKTPFFTKLKNLFRKDSSYPIAYFRMCEREEEEQAVKVSIIIQRRSFGKYISDITSSPQLNYSNDQINVTDLTR